MYNITPMGDPVGRAAAHNAGVGDAVGAKPGIVTLLLADVEGSTPRWEADAPAMLDALTALATVVDEIATRFDGMRPIEQGEGDSFVLSFGSARAAVDAAVALQSQRGSYGLSLRVALHTGEPEVLADGRLTGAVFNRCARVRDLGHGGQVLVSQATYALVVDDLDDNALVARGTHRLRGLTRPEDVWELRYEDAGEFAPLRSESDRGAGLPVDLDRFIGRADELKELRALLRSERLVTVTGAGGCGKTRLAIRCAAESGDAVYFADLARISTSEFVAEFVAGAIGVATTAGQGATEAIAAALRRRASLLVLDNCEHLVDACAALADALLRSSDMVTILATSREPLGIRGEVSWRVPSLATGDAVELFVDRARRARPGFDPGDQADVIAGICTQLDGIPLAVELAAARARVMSPTAIAEGLADRFHLLVGGRDVARQRTLEASVAWSHDLLGDAERVLLRRLAVFAGGFTLAAAEAVCAGDGLDALAVLDELTRLVDRSLVVVDVDAYGDTRYRLLETIRQFAEERLLDAGEAPRLRRAHLAHYRGFLAEAAEALRERVGPFIDRVEVEHDNVIAALRVAIAEGLSDEAFALAFDLYPAWRWWGVGEEPTYWLRRLLAVFPDAPAELRYQARSGLALSVMALGDLPSSRVEAQAVVDSGLVDDTVWGAMAHLLLGHLSLMEGDFVAARRHYAIGIEGGAQPVAYLDAEVLTMMGGLAFLEGDTNAARTLSAEGLRLALAADNPQEQGLALMMVGLSGARGGDLATMRSAALDMLALASDARDAWVAVMGLGLSGWHGFVSGHVEQAEVAFAELDRLLERGGLGIFEGLAHFCWALPAIITAAWDDAHRRTEAAIAKTGEMSMHYFDGWFYAALGEIERQAGNTAAAGAAFTRGSEVATGLGDRHHLAICRRGLALLERGQGDPNDQARVITDTIATIAELGGWLELPDSFEDLACVLCDGGQLERAVRLFGVAHAGRVAMGANTGAFRPVHEVPELTALRESMAVDAFAAAWDAGAALTMADAVAWLTRASGPRLRPSTGWYALTEVERNVATLVAGGLTNPEVAVRLFISRNTVKTHLKHVYEKLGIASRAELATRVARGE
jgi:predicted ATPase/class 3 adenylate cyclase/DNA-binding CsgD family transcriptional regulator